MQQDEKMLLNVKEVSKILGFAPRTIWEYSASGKLPAPVHLSKRVARWPRRVIMDWYDAQAAESKKITEKNRNIA